MKIIPITLPTPFYIGPVNVYLIKEDPVTLIDTGPKTKETVDLLLQDLSTKQIAGRMNISPNTAKAFLRSVMIKVGAENRTGIIGRILQASKSMNGENSFS